MRDAPKSHLVTENAGPARLQGRTAVHLDAPAADRQRSARALKASEIRYRRLFETAPDGILVLDGETGHVIDANPRVLELLEYAQAEVLDRPLWSIAAFKNAALTKNHFRELLDQKQVRYDDLPLESKGGRIKHVELVSTVFLADNKQLVQCRIRDVTDHLKREEEQGARAEAADLAATLTTLRTTDQATQDVTTGLINRCYLEEALPRELHRAARARVPLTVTLVALDGFHQLNEAYGPDAGDAMLREVARVLREHLRKSDMACRYRANEFVLVLPQSTPEGTVERIDQIRAALERIELFHGAQLLNGLSVSVGIATMGADGTTTRELLRAARAAVTAAKQGGGDSAEPSHTQETQ